MGFQKYYIQVSKNALECCIKTLDSIETRRKVKRMRMFNRETNFKNKDKINIYLESILRYTASI